MLFTLVEPGAVLGSIGVDCRPADGCSSSSRAHTTSPSWSAGSSPAVDHRSQRRPAARAEDLGSARPRGRRVLARTRRAAQRSIASTLARGCSTRSSVSPASARSGTSRAKARARPSRSTRTRATKRRLPTAREYELRESGPALLLGRSFVWFARVSEAVTTSTLSADVVAARANIVADRLTIPESGPHESRWYSCGISVAATAAACAGSGALPILIVGCGAGIWTSACKCLQAAHPDDPAVWQGPCENL